MKTKLNIISLFSTISSRLRSLLPLFDLLWSYLKFSTLDSCFIFINICLCSSPFIISVLFLSLLLIESMMTVKLYSD